jgi:hypothetical protein
MLVGEKLQPKISKDLWLFRYDGKVNSNSNNEKKNPS